MFCKPGEIPSFYQFIYGMVLDSYADSFVVQLSNQLTSLCSILRVLLMQLMKFKYIKPGIHGLSKSTFN